MDNYNHYKERTPEETIKIIEEFFKSKNCIIQKEEELISEIGTYSNTYSIIFKGHKILKSNGKGLDDIYCKASCYGELYERFCAFQIACTNPISYSKKQENNLRKYGYHLAKDEKLLSFDETMEDEVARKKLQYILPNLDKNLSQEWYNFLLGDKIYGIPYKSLENKNKIKYYNPLLNTFATGTNGFSAGNTLEEALVQGSSELYERYAIELLYTKKQNAYYYLNKNILPEKIRNLIVNIEKLGYDVFIYDLSFNFGLPVCMLLVIDKNKHIISKHFGSHPALHIAIERCLTEIYQGVPKLFTSMRDKVITPTTGLESYDIVEMSSHGLYKIESLPNELIFNSKEINYINDLIYINNESYTNIDLLDRVIKINNLNKIEFYYSDISLCDKMYAVHIRPTTFCCLCEDKANQEIQFKAENDNQYYNKIQTIILVSSFIKSLCLKNSTPSNDEILSLLNKINQFAQTNLIQEYRLFIDDVNRLTYFDLINNMNCNTLITSDEKNNILLCLTQFLNNLPNIDNEMFKNYFEPWRLYYAYCVKDQMSIEQFNKILKFFGYSNLSIDKKIDPITYIKYSLFESLQKIYNNEDYNEFLQLFDNLKKE